MSEPTDPDAGAIFRASAEQLAAFTTTWQTLIDVHVRSESGHCAAPECGRPGYGTHDYLTHPCGARALAEAARAHHRRRQ
jgi:hypothetical protein